MLRPFTQIIIQQIPTPLWTGRNLKFNLDFVTEYSIESTWEKHTDICKIKFPKNINLFGSPDGIFTYGVSNVIGGGSGTPNSPNIDASGQITTQPPLIMKGDIIIINHGYIARDGNYNEYLVATGNTSNFNNIWNLPGNTAIGAGKDLFFGYVSSVKSDVPIEISVEDNFYLLKRTPFPEQVWNQTTSGSSGTSLYGLMQHILDLTNNLFHKKNPLYPELTLLDIPSSITADFSLGYLDIGNLTCGQVLDKLKQQYHFESTFRGNVLQFGFPIYIDQTNPGVTPDLLPNSNNFFSFRDIYNQQGGLQMSANIFPSHDLVYSNKDDIVLTATVQCKIITPVAGGKTKMGQLPTRLAKLKAYIYWDIPTNSFKFEDVSSGVTPKTDIGDVGETHQFYYPIDKTKDNPTIADLVRLGKEQLRKYHYTGYRGCFTTFGFPVVQWNDNVNILDPVYSDRNGQYKVKRVVTKGGMHGLSQEIHLDYKIEITNGTTIPNNVTSIILF